MLFLERCRRRRRRRRQRQRQRRRKEPTTTKRPRISRRLSKRLQRAKPPKRYYYYYDDDDVVHIASSFQNRRQTRARVRRRFEAWQFHVERKGARDGSHGSRRWYWWCPHRSCVVVVVVASVVPRFCQRGVSTARESYDRVSTRKSEHSREETLGKMETPFARDTKRLYQQPPPTQQIWRNNNNNNNNNVLRSSHERVFAMRVFLLLHDERRERGGRSVTDRERGRREDDRKDQRRI